MKSCKFTFWFQLHGILAGFLIHPAVVCIVCKDSRLLGVVTVDVDISEISKVVEQIRMEYNGEIVLLQSNGAYIAGEEVENELGSLEWESV